MNKYISKIMGVMIIMLVALCITVGKAPSQESSAATDKKDTATVVVKNLENVFFETLPGKERVVLVVSQQPAIKAEGQTNGSLLIKLEDTIAAEPLLKGLGEGQLSNILRVTPSGHKINGTQWVHLLIDIKNLVPYSIKQEGKNIFVDFNVAGLPVRKTPITASATGIDKSSVSVPITKTQQKAAEEAKTKKEEITYSSTETRALDRRISIDFQDAKIESVLRIMAEFGNVSIVSGDDVKGNVTLSMKNVPWEQALDAILEVHSLTKRRENNVFIVTTIAKSKKDATEREQQKILTQKILAEKGLLRQIMIEAKIVEATEDFARTLGINWGFGGKQSIGSYGSAVSGGTNTAQTNAWRYGYPPEITLTDTLGNPLYMAAFNLASAFAGPTLGIVFGRGTSFLEAQLQALEKTTSGKIISSPKVVTMDDVKAVIKQGDEIPYIIESISGGVITRTVAFKEALLRLEVKPKITEEGKISMEIKATNDRADYTRVVLLNPPIRKNEVESTVVIDNGDTVVIGGVNIDSDEKVDEGVPWILRIPILGYLFKTQEVTKSRKQLLVFITPKILKGSDFAASTEKAIN